MQNTLFDLNSHYSSKWYIFKNATELGAIYDTINWKDLETLLPEKKTAKGAPSWLPVQGLFGLMFLKHYTGLSDEKLLERFHTDWAFQLFCGVLLQDNERIKDNAFVSHVRAYLGKHLDLNQMQIALLQHWKKDDLENLNLNMFDATCFESYIRYPTDVKLLWECVEKLWDKFIPKVCEAFKLKLPRSKFKEQKRKYLNYSKLRKKSKKKTKARQKALLYLLEKGIETFEQLLSQTQGGNLPERLFKTFATIKAICKQQKQIFQDPQAKIKDRIVSIHKPYVRPIIRGKENKPVEFGMKVHMNQVDGISWVEYASFDNFNEGKRLKYSILKHNLYIGECTHISADRIYAINENRNFVTGRKIKTNFDKKGPKKQTKEEKALKAQLNAGRSAYMEGSFGNEKSNYCLRKIKARTKETEMVWMFFGVMTANAVAIATRRVQKQKEKENQRLAA